MKNILCGFVLTGLALSFFSSTAESQRMRASETIYFRLGGGYSVDETDFPSYAVEPFALIGEIGYQFNHSWSIGFGYQYADYPKLPTNYVLGFVDGDYGSVRHTPHLLFRFVPNPARRISHYLHGGGNATFGGPGVGLGLSGGIGVDFVLGRRISLFAEVTGHTQLPDDAVDGVVGGRARWDALGIIGGGLRMTIRPASTRAEVEPQGPEIAERGDTVTFTAVVNDDATRPVNYIWSFGDGRSARGETVEHTYALEGDYHVSVRAENRWGASSGTIEIRIDEPRHPVEIIEFDAEPLNVEVGDQVRFSSQIRGSSDISYTLDFGDGTDHTATGDTRHSYEETGRHIGLLNLAVGETHRYLDAGTYIVTLRAENPLGEQERNVTINVTGELCPECPDDPCARLDALNTIYFRFDRDDLTDEARRLLENNVDQLRECPNVMVRVNAYTDHAGPSDYNQRLSERRAGTVERFYQEQGIGPNRIETHSLGEAPVRCHADEERIGCRTNRRAESIPVHTGRGESPDDSSPEQGGRNIDSPVGEYFWIIGSFSSHVDAERKRGDLRHRNIDADILEMNMDGTLVYRVAVGSFKSRSLAWQQRSALPEEFPADSWLLKVE